MKIANKFAAFLMTVVVSTAFAHGEAPSQLGIPLNDDQRAELIEAINQDAMVHAALLNEIKYGEKCTFTLNKATDQGGEYGWSFEAEFICSTPDTPTEKGGPMFMLEMSGIYLSKLIIDATYEVDRNHP